MSLFRKEFYVSNPSPYERSDYIEVDLSHLGIPDDVESFKLFRLWGDSKQEKQEISYQIDKIYGSNNRKRVLRGATSNGTKNRNKELSLGSAMYIQTEVKFYF
jgi:hypothetical protein